MHVIEFKSVHMIEIYLFILIVHFSVIWVYIAK